MAQQPRLDVFLPQRFLQQRIVEQIDLADGQIVRRSPVGINAIQFFGRLANSTCSLFSYATVYLFAWITISFVASSHAALFKRDSRSLAGWVGVIWLVPIAGAALYLMFGINRIQRRAQKRRRTDDAQGSSTPRYHAGAH